MLRVLACIGVSAVALGIQLQRVPFDDLLAAVGRIPPPILLLTIVLHTGIFAIAALRWSLLFTACGSPSRPRFLQCYRAFWIGDFYNVWLPGGLGGDVVRAVATRRAAVPAGLPASLGIILLERTFGATALLLVAFTSASLFPIPGLGAVRWWSALGLATTLTAVGVLATVPHLSAYLPRPVARITRRLPPIVSPRYALAAFALSTLVQLGSVGAAHLLMLSTGAAVTWRDALTVLPLANASAFFPFTIAGVGARETAFVTVYGYIGVPRAFPLATALTISALSYVIGAIGGVVHLVAPLTIDRDVADAAGAPLLSRTGDR